MAVITSLVSYWALDEASGDALDSHGSNTLGEHGGPIAATTGKVSGARDLESTSSQVFYAADNADLSVADVDFSICAWVKAESLSAAMEIAAKGDNGTNGPWALSYQTADNRFRFHVSSGAGYANYTRVVANNFGAPSTATWYFVVAWHDSVANTINIQVNDGTVDSTSYTFGCYDDALNFAVGAIGFAGEYWDGLIDEVGWWKKVLTSTERTWLYNSGNGRSYADIVAEANVAVAYAPSMMSMGLG